MVDLPTPHAPPPVARDRLAVVERIVIVGLFLAMTIVGIVQIVNRHGLQLPVWNLEQLLPHMFIAITFIGLPMVYRHRAYLAVEVVPDALPARVRRAYRLVLWLITAAFLGALVWTSIDVLQFQLEINAVTNMGYPAAILTATVPLGAALALWRLWKIEILPLLRGED
jgi:TRAP-type C4-dicarboxylate transport system permease small subunit